ncbi:MAG: M24 family metallopeptidase [Candidatus Mycalebacterium zealandia]|nr:MAG: M24 family metallopeptidase [Candidatus Mycalebacterium zealandia]
MKSEKAFLIIDSSENNPDLLYAIGGFFVPDPVVFIRHKNRSFLVLSDLELARGRKDAAVSAVLPLSSYTSQLRGAKKRSLADVAALVLREKGISRVEVQRTFPLAFAESLKKNRVKVSCCDGGMLFEERMRKTQHEVSLIRAALKDTASALKTAIDMISTSEPRKNGVLFLHGKPLTSERIRLSIHTELAGKGYGASGTIVACGEHSAMPHHSGEGPVFANHPVVIDIFPKSAHGYYGDMTRTVIKGSPSPELARMYKTVLKGQKIAIGMIKHGVKCADIHNAVLSFFDSEGFVTERGENPRGFIHSTGHGLGMGLHEPPGIGPSGGVLSKGNVVTVEPGLYYEGVGGIRIEDVVFVTKKGCENLTKCPKVFSR